MTPIKESLTSKILPKDITDKNQTVLNFVKYYSKVSDIIERTYIAMGKKSVYKIKSSSTANQIYNMKIN